jgi:hypothetical protein
MAPLRQPAYRCFPNNLTSPPHVLLRSDIELTVPVIAAYSSLRVHCSRGLSEENRVAGISCSVEPFILSRGHPGVQSDWMVAEPARRRSGVRVQGDQRFDRADEQTQGISRLCPY